MIKGELSRISSPIHISGLGLSAVQTKLDIITKMLLGIFVIYILGIILSGVSILIYILALLFNYRAIIRLETIAMFLATIFLLLGSSIITTIVVKGVSGFNTLGEGLGVLAERGAKFLAITWTASFAMFMATVCWCLLIRAKRAGDDLFHQNRD
jgi:hypothetical protein